MTSKWMCLSRDIRVNWMAMCSHVRVYVIAEGMDEDRELGMMRTNCWPVAPQLTSSSSSMYRILRSCLEWRRLQSINKEKKANVNTYRGTDWQ